MPVPVDSLFGTDGIRGRWGTPPMDPDSLQCLGAALASVLGPCRLLIGEDTRESSASIREHLLAGMGRRQRAGVCGVIPTPGLAWAVRTGEWDWGVMITASHNPWTDNGIKLFARDGGKADDDMEARITAAFHGGAAGSGDGADRFACDAAGMYAAVLRHWGKDLHGRGIPVVIDAANGAAAAIAVDLFADLGYAADVRCAAPDGRNINLGCGATQLDLVRSAVRETGAALGIALDGDGDRVLFTTAGGAVITGDHVLFALAGGLADKPAGYAAGVVGTVMSNMGLEKELSRRNITFLRAPVGDRHVAGMMRREGFSLGGEPSGHTIFAPLQPTGDGLLTALLLLGELGDDPAAAAARLENDMMWFAQETRSVMVKRKRDLDSWPELQAILGATRNRFGDRARLLVRYSGTESKLRIMAEAEDPGTVSTILDSLEDLIREDDARGG